MIKFDLPVKGPFIDEAQFKAAVLKYWRNEALGATFFELEEAEKNPGLPDCLEMNPCLPAVFHEFKISDANGIIVFQKSQPLFYKTYHNLNIQILAWDSRHNYVVRISKEEVIRAKSLRMRIPEDL